MLTIKAHFDGKVLVPDEPIDLPADQDVILQVEPVAKERPSFHELIGWALQFPANPNPRRLTDDEIWGKPRH